MSNGTATYYLFQLGVPSNSGTNDFTLATNTDISLFVLGAFSANVSTADDIFGANVDDSVLAFMLPAGSNGAANGGFPTTVTGTITGDMTLTATLPVDVTLYFVSAGSKTLIQTLPAGSLSTPYSFPIPPDERGFTEAELRAYFNRIAAQVAAA